MAASLIHSAQLNGTSSCLYSGVLRKVCWAVPPPPPTASEREQRPTIVREIPVRTMWEKIEAWKTFGWIHTTGLTNWLLKVCDICVQACLKLCWRVKQPACVYAIRLPTWNSKLAAGRQTEVNNTLQWTRVAPSSGVPNETGCRWKQNRNQGYYSCGILFLVPVVLWTDSSESPAKYSMS